MVLYFEISLPFYYMIHKKHLFGFKLLESHIKICNLTVNNSTNSCEMNELICDIATLWLILLNKVLKICFLMVLKLLCFRNSHGCWSRLSAYGGISIGNTGVNNLHMLIQYVPRRAYAERISSIVCKTNQKFWIFKFFIEPI